MSDERAERPKKRRKGRMGALRTLLLCGLLAAGGAAVWLTQVNPFPGRETTLLVLGTDAGADGVTRSDTLVVARVRLKPSFKVRLVAVPRDTRVTIPKRGRHKINAAYALGGEALCRETLAYNFDVEPERTAVLSSEAMGKLVDALGGVTVEVPRRMQYVDRAQDLKIDLQPGVQRLNGDQAVQFLRWRGDGLGDLGRMERQRQFLTSLTKEAASPLGLLRLPLVINAARTAVKSELSVHEMAYLAWHGLRGGSSSLQMRKLEYRLAGSSVRVQAGALRRALDEGAVENARR